MYYFCLHKYCIIDQTTKNLSDVYIEEKRQLKKKMTTSATSVQFNPENVEKFLNLLIDPKTHLPIPCEVKYLKQLIKDLGRIEFIVFCYRTAIYLYPTHEMLQWLKDEVGKANLAIEIGSGNNGIAKFLGIQGTDNYCQTIPWVKAQYSLLRQKTTNPNLADVEKIDAASAIANYQPDLVVGSWITPTWNGDKGNVYGPALNYLTRQKLILIGNQDVHGEFYGDKCGRIYQPPFLISRAKNPELDCIYIWE